ncbi:DMT family transporter [Vogesella indigofera]|uniref:DMT family transporter n=1 Tax=Vogesella indigofera TaxID=45465 RepID=UPI00234ECE1F|nr:DMT family transporter [Vogesella indigofera]MDC7699676.1 DMT family transporter [Vogesella indigofera]
MDQARVGKVAAADAVLLLVTLLAATGWLFSKQVLQHLPPLLFMSLRFGVAGLLLLLLCRWRGALLPSRALRPALGCGLLFGVSMMLWIKGLQHSSNLGVAAFICSMGVVLAPFASRLLLGTQLSRAAWLSMALAGLGMACMSLRAGGGLHASDWLFLAFALCSAAYLSLNSHFMALVPALPATALQLLVVAVLCLLGSVLSEAWSLPALLASWHWLLASILLATCLRFLLQNWGQGKMPIARAAFILLLEPVWTALLASWWFGSVMTGLQWLGAGLILAAILVSRHKPRRPASLQSPVPAGKTGQ